jgi:hypothetical protein
LDSYGWIEYFTEGPLAEEYARYVEEASEENTVIPTIVVQDFFSKTFFTLSPLKNKPVLCYIF